jgi:hypothetical protein
MPHAADQYRRAAEEAKQLAEKATDSCERVQLWRGRSMAAAGRLQGETGTQATATIKLTHYPALVLAVVIGPLLLTIIVGHITFKDTSDSVQIILEKTRAMEGRTESVSKERALLPMAMEGRAESVSKERALVSGFCCRHFCRSLLQKVRGLSAPTSPVCF